MKFQCDQGTFPNRKEEQEGEQRDAMVEDVREISMKRTQASVASIKNGRGAKR